MDTIIVFKDVPRPYQTTLKALRGIRSRSAMMYVLALAPDYADQPERYLRGPKEDVQHLEKTCSKFPYIQFTLLLGEFVTTDKIIRAIEKMLSKCTENDIFVLYLAGHGESPSTGYEFVTQSGAHLTHRHLLDTISRHCAPGTRVLQIRDTCGSSPRPEEIQEILSNRPSLCMNVLAACDVGEQTWERGPTLPRSDFLRNLVHAIEILAEELNKSPSLALKRQVVAKMLNQVLCPMGVGDTLQTPQLEPRKDNDKVVDFLAEFISRLELAPTNDHES